MREWFLGEYPGGLNLMYYISFDKKRCTKMRILADRALILTCTNKDSFAKTCVCYAMLFFCV